MCKEQWRPEGGSTEADCEAIGGEWTNCTNANRVTGDTDQEAAATLICK